jgi:hypothetical protein
MQRRLSPNLGKLCFVNGWLFRAPVNGIYLHYYLTKISLTLRFFNSVLFLPQAHSFIGKAFDFLRHRGCRNEFPPYLLRFLVLRLELGGLRSRAPCPFADAGDATCNTAYTADATAPLRGWERRCPSAPGLLGVWWKDRRRLGDCLRGLGGGPAMCYCTVPVFLHQVLISICLASYSDEERKWGREGTCTVG